MSAREHKKLGEVATLSLEDLTDRCKDYSTKIQTAYATANGSKHPTDIQIVYNIITEATKYFVRLQEIARTKDAATTQEILKSLQTPSLEKTLKNFTSLINEERGERDRDNILQNFGYARTQVMNESDESLKGLRKLMSPSSNITPAENKTISSSTPTATLPIQTTAEPKPDAMERTPSTVTAAEAKRTAEITAATTRINAAHQEAIQLLTQIKDTDAKTLAGMCVNLSHELAKVPFTEPELTVEELWNLLEDTIVSLSALQRLARTIQDKEQAQLLINAAATQAKEGRITQFYIQGRNENGPKDANLARLCSKLLYMMSNNLASDPHKMADGTPSQIKSEQKYLQGKVDSLLQACKGWIEELNTIPASDSAFTIAAIQATLKEATKDFADLQRKVRRLRSLEMTIAGLSEEERNLYDLSNEKHPISIETMQSDTSSFESHIKALSQQTYKEEDHDKLLANFLRFKNTPFTDTIPQPGKPAEQKASSQLTVDSQRAIHTSTVSTANNRIQIARATLTQQLTSSQAEPSISDVVGTIRLIIRNSIGIKALLDNEEVDERTKKTIRPIWEDLQDKQYLTNLKPLLTAKFSKPQAESLLDALRDNNLPLLLEQLPKPEPKEAKKGKLSALTDMFKKKSGQSPATSPNKATPKPADNTPPASPPKPTDRAPPKDSDNSGPSSGSASPSS